MITAALKQILTDSGCTLVIYDQDKLANLFTDQSNQTDIIGVIFQPNTIDLEVKANAIHEHYNPLVIDIAMQVRLEDKAETNKIGTQVWMMESLKVEHYNDGTPITIVSDYAAWAALVTEGMCYYTL